MTPTTTTIEIVSVSNIEMQIGNITASMLVDDIDAAYLRASKFVDEIHDPRWRPKIAKWVSENINGIVIPITISTDDGFARYAEFTGCTDAEILLFKLRWL